MPTLGDTDPILTTAEAASYSRVKREALAQLRFQGKGPAYLRPTPRTILYRRSALDAWLRASEEDPSRAVA